MAERKILQATESFSVYLPDGTPFVVVAGERFWSDDQVAAGREHLFGELKVRSSAPAKPPTTAHVETTSAAPGTKRTVSRGLVSGPSKETSGA